MEFEERSIKIKIDTSHCSTCKSKACVAACATYDRGTLTLVQGEPSVNHLDKEEVARRGTECLACEYACWKEGRDVIRIEIPIRGLDQYIQGTPLSRGQ